VSVDVVSIDGSIGIVGGDEPLEKVRGTQLQQPIATLVEDAYHSAAFNNDDPREAYGKPGFYTPKARGE
jgi:hypothetical protein